MESLTYIDGLFQVVGAK